MKAWKAVPYGFGWQKEGEPGTDTLDAMLEDLMAQIKAAEARIPRERLIHQPGDHYFGKLRAIVHKTAESGSGDLTFEECLVDYFDDTLITDVNRLSTAEVIRLELDSVGLTNLEEAIEKILEAYEVDDYVEIVADYFQEWITERGWSEYPSDPDCHSWLENVRHRKLNDMQVARFIPERERDG